MSPRSGPIVKEATKSMKKIVILLVLLVSFLFGCKNNTGAHDARTSSEPSDTPDVKSSGYHSEAFETSNKEVYDMDDIIYREGEWDDKDWDNIEFPIEKDCIDDKETAVNVARALLGNFQKQNYFVNYVTLSVFYDIKDKIWIVVFAESRDYPGADVTIAIRRENAEVVKMWVGE